nr:hypothetical protein CFP56_02743 [Quercus suber]
MKPLGHEVFRKRQRRKLHGDSNVSVASPMDCNSLTQVHLSFLIHSVRCLFCVTIVTGINNWSSLVNAAADRKRKRLSGGNLQIARLHFQSAVDRATTEDPLSCPAARCFVFDKLGPIAVMRFTSVFTVLAVAVNAATSNNDPSLCSCGFRDPASNKTYTESLILYFNETENVNPRIFTTETYDHRKEKGWKITYRQGAVSENVAFGDEGALPWQDQIDGNSSTLELWTDPSTLDHLVNGAQLRSVREDILYGSFRAEMRSAQPWIGGSALTFALKYNDSTSLSMDMCNQDNPQDARITNLINGEWPETDSIVVNRSVANVRWVRAFFNSSLMSDRDHQAYDQRCNATAQCSTEDNTLRISTPYSPAAIKPYEEPTMNQHIRWIAGVVAAVFSSFGVATLINAVVRRGPWKKIKSLMTPTKSDKSSKKLKKALRNSLSAPPKSCENLAEGLRETSVSTGSATPLPTYASRVNTPGHATPAPSYRSNGSVSGPASGAPSATVTPRPSFMDLRTQPQSHIDPINSHSKSPAGSIYPVNEEDVLSPNSNHESYLAQSSSQNAETCELNCTDEVDKTSSLSSLNVLDNRDRGTAGTVVAPLHDPGVPQAVENIVEFNMGQTTKNGLPAKEKKQLPAPPKQQRIDYLSGFLVFSCLGVTLRHFSLTFWPYVTESYGPVEHFKADHWLAYVLGPYLLTPLWIGPFFVTSCRFLAARYLKNGKLPDIANKILLRGPRMLIPCFIFIILEYFLLELGLTGDLEWLPSISWSTWPYVTPQPNFGVFLNELVELSYLIPNGAPEVINHYCVGVLWTIPVQHFFSYVTLLAAVMIRDVKNPWKRFLFYTLTIICGWYASVSHPS